MHAHVRLVWKRPTITIWQALPFSWSCITCGTCDGDWRGELSEEAEKARSSHSRPRYELGNASGCYSPECFSAIIGHARLGWSNEGTQEPGAVYASILFYSVVFLAPFFFLLFSLKCFWCLSACISHCIGRHGIETRSRLILLGVRLSLVEQRKYMQGWIVSTVCVWTNRVVLFDSLYQHRYTQSWEMDSVSSSLWPFAFGFSSGMGDNDKAFSVNLSPVSVLVLDVLAMLVSSQVAVELTQN